MTPPVHARRHRHWLFTLLTLLVTAAQLTVALAPLAEGTESRLASHVEANGTSTHFSHDQAKCTACRPHSIHGTTERPEAPLIVTRLAESLAGTAAMSIDSAGFNAQSNPRAPPFVS